MNGFAEYEALVLPALVAGIAGYVLLRWAAVPLLNHALTGLECLVNVLVAGVLLPEYYWTRAQRRLSGQAAPFAYAYGDAVCAVASAGQRCAGTVLGALREAAGRLGHRGSLCGGLLLAAVLVWSGRP
ncbi:hypothetical protein ACSMX9_10940 [Streptomyces sp. LE64]|uniref:hypothetical protein n=1 Tax=Streptomyces sp. LE64 TaxID=3448653 RepID=UPI004041AE47